LRLTEFQLGTGAMTAKLYDLELSGNCYKVRLLRALLSVPLEIVD
jgi:glutathione S-transferase